MASTKEYADYVLGKFEKLSDVVTIRPMMGEYVVHMAGRVLGFVADDQLLIQDTPSLQPLLPSSARRELFPGSKLFCVVDDDISPYKLCEIARAIYDELPVSKPRKKKKADPEQKSPEPAFPFEKFNTFR